MTKDRPTAESLARSEIVADLVRYWCLPDRSALSGSKSVQGQNAKFRGDRRMSALAPKADISAERLQIARQTIKPSDPWISALRELRGQVGFDRVDRIATEAIFEKQKVPIEKRTPEAVKGLRGLMVGTLAVCRKLQPRSSSSGSARTAYFYF